MEGTPRRGQAHRAPRKPGEAAAGRSGSPRALRAAPAAPAREPASPLKKPSRGWARDHVVPWIASVQRGYRKERGALRHRAAGPGRGLLSRGAGRGWTGQAGVASGRGEDRDPKAVCSVPRRHRCRGRRLEPRGAGCRPG